MTQEELNLTYEDDELKWLWDLINKTMAEAEQNMLVDPKDMTGAGFELSYPDKSGEKENIK